MRLKQSDITNISCRIYGRLATYAYPNDWFSSITVAASTTGGDGFVVAGHSDSINKYPVWIEKLDRLGVPIWSHVFRPLYDDGSGVDPVGVVERYSTNYTSHNYYAATTSTAGMLVMRLDDNGNSFTSSTPVDNFSEFLFQKNNGNASQAAALSYLDDGGPHDQGIHVFGTYSNAGDLYFVEAPFNGSIRDPATCDSSRIGVTTAQINGPIRSVTVGINTTSGLSLCTNFSINSSVISLGIINDCVNHHIPQNGSMNKGSVTGVTVANISVNSFHIFPNPATDKIHIELNLDYTTTLQLSLYDALGRFVAKIPTLESHQAGSQSFDIGLNALSLENGIYFIKITDDTKKEYQQKLIYIKE